MIPVILTLINIISLLTSVFVWIIIVQFVLSLLISFNVVNTHNQFVEGLYSALNSVIEPVCRPIRKLLPDTGMIDFSPLVVIIGLQIVNMILAQAVVPNLLAM